MQSPVVVAQGPPGVVRVALTDFRWPLDPALAQGRDETTLARALYSTPLRTDPVTGRVLAGLCSAWEASDKFREWRFRCTAAASVATALRRLVHLPDASAHRLFADTTRIAATGSTVIVRLRFPWRRFPYALTVVGAAPRFVPGPFRLVQGSPELVVLRGTELTLMFQKLTVRAARRAFERGEVDDAPVRLGDLGASRAQFGDVVHARTLLALDLLRFRQRVPRALRRVYWLTAGRGDYAELVGEQRGAEAYGLLGSSRKPKPSEVRDARESILELPRILVRVEVPPDPVLRYGARLLYADWRDVGLGPQLVSQKGDASFERVFALYPQEEALPWQLAPDVGVLAATQQRAALARLDRTLRAGAGIVPVAWVVDARLVSPRLDGWREDALGNVDYAAVRSRASSRRP